MDLAPSGWVDEPLELLVGREVDAAKYGGASLYANASIVSAQVTELLRQVPPDCLDEVAERAVARRDFLPVLAWVEFDGLTTADWTTVQEEDLDTEVDRFFEVLDGPLRRWAVERSTADRLLAVQSAPGASEAQQPDLVRSMAVLAVQQGFVHVARGLLAGYVPAGRADTADRVRRFEIELARLLPTYGAPART